MDLEKRITVKVDDDFHRAARVKAAQDNRSVSDVVRGLLTAWLQGKAEPALEIQPAQKQQQT